MTIGKLSFADLPSSTQPSKRPHLNLVEQVNQTFTYLTALAAAKLLLEWHPEAGGLRLAPGAHAPKDSLDIEGLNDRIVGAETFASVDPKNNGKISGDVEKMSGRPEKHRYVLFHSPKFKYTERVPSF